MGTDFQVIDRRHGAQPESADVCTEAPKVIYSPTPIDASHLGSGADPFAGKKSFHEKWDEELKVPGEDDPRMQEEIAQYEAIEPRESRDPETLETIAQMREENSQAVKDYRWEKQEELGAEHEQERLGELLHGNELIRRLRRAGLKCWLSQGRYPQMMGLQVLEHGEPKYACFVQVPWMPEFSVMRFDDHGLPTSEKHRGWRTVLLRLISGGFLSEQKAIEEFGEATGVRARRFNETLFALRNA